MKHTSAGVNLDKITIIFQSENASKPHLLVKGAVIDFNRLPKDLCGY